VVRFNGGAQAAHSVVRPDGRQHAFAQFGSGTFTPGVRTHLSRFMLVDPLALAAEAAHLAAGGVDGIALTHLDVARRHPLRRRQRGARRPGHAAVRWSDRRGQDAGGR
jgi:adenylosuccinate synthase